MNRQQWKVLLIGIPGIIGMGLFSHFYTSTYNSLEEVKQVYLSEVIAATIGVTIFSVRKKFKTEQLEAYEFLMIIMMGVIAGIHLIPEEFDRATIVIGISIATIVGWFVGFVLWKYLDEDNQMDTGTFVTSLMIFLGLTSITIVGFNFVRIVHLFNPN